MFTMDPFAPAPSRRIALREDQETCPQVWEAPELALSPVTPRSIGRFLAVVGFGAAAGWLGIVAAALGTGEGALAGPIDGARALAAFGAVLVCAIGLATWCAADRWLFDPLERLSAAAAVAARQPGRIGIWGRERPDAFGKIARAIERMQTDRQEALARAAAAEARGANTEAVLADLARRVRAETDARRGPDRSRPDPRTRDAEVEPAAPRMDLAAAAGPLHQLRRAVAAQREIVAELVGALRDRRPVPEPRLLQALAGAEVVVRAADDCARRAAEAPSATERRNVGPSEVRPRTRAAA